MKNVTKKAATLVVVLMTSMSFAQDGISSDDRNEMKFGVKAGVNFANVYDEKGDDFVADGKAGLAVGAFASIPLGELFGIQPEVMYSQKGYKSSGDILGIGYDYKVTSSYLDIPVLLQVKPSQYFTLLAGPQFSYLLDTKYELNGNSTIDEEDINGDNYKKGVFGAVVGVDFNYQNFVLGTRLGWDVSKTNEDGDANSPRFKNKVIQVTFGYRF